MKNLVKKYRELSFEKRTIVNTKISIFTNMGFALVKSLIFIISKNIYFLVAGIVNLFITLSKYECYQGETHPGKKSFFYRNLLTGIFLILGGIEYSIYMGRMIFSDVEIMKYDTILGISVALVSFIELGFSIKGLFNAYGKGHYYRNIKTINLCTSLTSIALTEVAIMSFASEVDSRFEDGLFGIIVGIFIIFAGIFILIAPYFSLVDHQRNDYQEIDGEPKENEYEIQLTNSKIYGNYIYKGTCKDGKVEGNIVKGKSPLFELNIFVKIILIILSEILIFPYLFFAFVFFFKNGKVINKLDKIMKDKGFEKIKLEEEEGC